MTAPIPFSKYSDTQKYVSLAPSWVPPTDQERISAYDIYEQVFWNHVGAVKIMNRGLDAADQPLYVPSARVVVDTMDRYVGAGLTFSTDPETGTTATQLAARQWFTALFARERFSSRYDAAKRDHLLIKGDMVWHITYDELKPAGSRISLHATDPASYFPVYEDELPENLQPDSPDPNRIAQIRLVERVLVGDEEQVRVQLYDRTGNGVTILTSLEMWKPDEWFVTDGSKSALATLQPPTPLPSQVTTFPVYHIPNGGDGYEFGSSEMRGLLGLQAAMNQGMTDEDLALALMGIGVFATDEAAVTRDGDGNVVPLSMYPGIVIENAKGLRRVEGITTVQPYTDHFARIEGYMGDATGATDAARGRMEVTEAESGVALRIRLGPTLAKAGIKDRIILAVMTQMFYDLVQMWSPLDPMEGISPFLDVSVVPVLGDKLPANRAEEVTLWSSLVVSNIASAATARKALVKVGFEFDPSEAELLLAEKVATAAAEGGDPAQDRATNEVNDGSALNSPPVA